MDQLDASGSIVAQTVKKNIRPSFVSLMLNTTGTGATPGPVVRHIAKLTLDMTVKKVTFCLRGDSADGTASHRCFSQKNCGQMAMVMTELRSLTGVNGFGMKIDPLPTPGDSLYAELLTKLTAKTRNWFG